LYQAAATAFLTACLLNMTSLAFEDSVAKRELALLGIAIKGLQAYSYWQQLAETPLVMYDRHGVM
jgi:hypothetical protein